MRVVHFTLDRVHTCLNAISENIPNYNQVKPDTRSKTYTSNEMHTSLVGAVLELIHKDLPEI
jgi:hypothetical protein